MNADVLTTRVADGIAVITLGCVKCIFFDEEMGDALTESLHDPNCEKSFSNVKNPMRKP